MRDGSWLSSLATYRGRFVFVEVCMYVCMHGEQNVSRKE